MLRFFRSNRDEILVALLAGIAVAVLNAFIPEIREAAARAAAPAGWLFRPTGWPPILVFGFIVTGVFALRRRS